MARRALFHVQNHEQSQAALFLGLLKRAKACFVFAATACVFALLMLAPRVALALIVPVCEHDVLSRAPAAKLETSCEGSNDAQADPGDPNAAPMCDEQGVSREAPPRILPIVDARIDAIGSAACSTEFEGPAVGPQEGKAPLPSSSVFGELASLFTLDAIAKSPLTGFSSFVPVEGRPRLGYGRGVYHPPR